MLWRIGPPLSMIVREPVLLNKIEGTVRSSRLSKLGRYWFRLRAGGVEVPFRLERRLLLYRFHMVVAPVNVMD
jgi:hypothetical protein